MSYPRNHCQIQCPKVFRYAFFQDFYSFRSHVWVSDPFWANSCIRHKVRVQLHSFTCGHLIFPASFLEEIVLSPLSILGSLVENHLTIYVRVYFQAPPVAFRSFWLTSFSLLIRSRRQKPCLSVNGSRKSPCISFSLIGSLSNPESQRPEHYSSNEPGARSEDFCTENKGECCSLEDNCGFMTKRRENSCWVAKTKMSTIIFSFLSRLEIKLNWHTFFGYTKKQSFNCHVTKITLFKVDWNDSLLPNLSG